jgi:hypothetical protein
MESLYLSDGFPLRSAPQQGGLCRIVRGGGAAGITRYLPARREWVQLEAAELSAAEGSDQEVARRF